MSALAALAVSASGCTSVVGGKGVRSSTSASPSPSVSPLPPDACPATYAPPDPARPKVRLEFTVEPDLATVHGVESIRFTPDKDISELVFRLTPNTASSYKAGNGIQVTGAMVDHGGRAPTYTRNGAAPQSQGGLLHIPFASTIRAGTTVSAALTFDLRIGDQSFDRFGRTGAGAKRFAWFASAHPLLAWERGFGWHTEDMVQFAAESATSEAMDTDLTVTAPSGDVVIMSGDPADPPADGTVRRWHATIATARDVSVAVGPFQVKDTVVGGVGGTRLRVGAYDVGERDRLVPEFTRAITELSKRFGPYPFPSLSIARLPANGGGIEYPSSVLMLDGSRLVAVHETAHQWFYAMVGDSQALHPWLDEAFATYAEELVNGEPDHSSDLRAPGAVDRSTESYASDVDRYYFFTYAKGSAALEAARAAAGPAKWDAAIRCYVNRNAWRIASPSDLRAEIAMLPAAVQVLRQAGAL